MSDAPTQRFDAQPPAAPDDKRRSPLPLILGIIGGVLLIAVIILLVLLLGKNNANPTASDTNIPPTDGTAASSTPVPVPTVTVTETPPPSGNTGGGGSVAEKPNGSNVLITQYTISPTTIKCSAGMTQLHITWKSVNGYAAFFGVNTIDAQAAGMGWTLPASGSDHDFAADSAYPYKVDCNTSPNSYSITVVGNGSKQTLTIKLNQTP